MKIDCLTLKQVLDKHPHLAELYLEEALDQEELSEVNKKEKKLLLDW